MPRTFRSGIKGFSASLFNLVFPDDCRICEQRLVNLSRIPVCPSCLFLAQQPLSAEFFCRSCQTPFVDSYPLDEGDLCTVCREGLVNFDSAYSFGSYEGPLRSLIHLFKYSKVESLAVPLGRLVLQALPLDQRVDAVIGMPMHWRKRWSRGFNQAELLARYAATRYGLKLSTNLCRTRYAEAQAGLNEAQRQRNIENSFAVKRPEQIRGRRVLLVDDVFTTGATLRAASAALKSAGAAHVTALTLARVNRRSVYSILSSAGLTGRAQFAGVS